MKQKLKKVLLIDDSNADNFIHKRRIENMDITDEVVIKLNGKIALEYLNESFETTGYPAPELIFLDINMPVMNGWEFLEHYNQLKKEKQGEVILAMLTTSTAAEDREKAEQIGEIATFITKPLTALDLQSIITEHFPRLAESN